MHNQYIKYIEGSLKRMKYARADLLFFLRIKALFPQGYISRSKAFLSFISHSLGENKSTCHVRLNSLLQLGLIEAIYKEGSIVGYKLIKNNDLWEALGYKRNEKTFFNHRGNGHKNNFKICKIDFIKFKDKKSLLKEIQDFDIVQKIKKMAHKELKANKPSQTTGVFVSLSCAGFAKALGYSSKISGFKVKERLLGSGSINVLKVPPKLRRRKHIAAHIKQKKIEKIHAIKLNLNPHNNKEYFVMDCNGYGFVYERQCDRISLNDRHFEVNFIPKM